MIAGAIGVVAKSTSSRSTSGMNKDGSTKSGATGRAGGRQAGLSIAYQGNVADLWEYLAEHKVPIELGVKPASTRHAGVTTPGLSLEQSAAMMRDEPEGPGSKSMPRCEACGSDQHDVSAAPIFGTTAMPSTSRGRC